MQDPRQITPKILVTTDFSLDSERAFYHALAFAVARQARLTLLHTGPVSGSSVPWDKFPSVRETLAGWGLLPADAPRTAVAEHLNVGIAKMAMRDDDPRQGIADYLRKSPTDLLVMATESRSGLARLLRPSVAEGVSYVTKTHTLMLPKRGRGFVDPATGLAKLERVLCALDLRRDPRPALAYLRQWLPVLGGDAIEVVLLQTAEHEEQQEFLLPQLPGQQWRHEVRPGDFIEVVAASAAQLKADLVVINSRRPPGPLTRWRGSRNDRILRDLGLPLLTIPLL